VHRDRTQSTSGAAPRDLKTHHRESTSRAGAKLPDLSSDEAVTTLVFFFLDLGLSRITFLNRRVTDFFGYTGSMRESALETLLAKVHPDDIGRVRDVIASWTVRDEQPAGDVEFRAKAACGRWRWMLCRTIVFEPDTEGAAPAILGTAEDVTEQRKRRSFAEATSEVAHDLSQPLSSIANYAAGCSARLRSGAGRPEDILPALERIASEARRAGQLVRDLRTLAKDEATAGESGVQADGAVINRGRGLR
jgi:PAS domain S-box-containing protein